MADISAADVMKLRKMSSQGMMDCKKALIEADGDIDEAMIILRKKGLATLEKRAGRDTTEGIVIVKSSDDGKMMAMATLCCETDFVAKGDDFVAAADGMGSYMLACDADEGAEALGQTTVDGQKLADAITEMVSKTGEKTEVCDYTRFKTDAGSIIGSYVHFNNKLGAMVEIATDGVADGESLKVAANDVAMHITACNPMSLDRTSIDAALIESERAIAAEQMKNKPANIIEKIVDGKMNKFFAENCLVDQAFVKNEDTTISKLVDETAKKAGGTAKIKRFVRFEIG